MKHKFGLVPEPLSELGRMASALLQKNDANPACARRVKTFFREFEEAAGPLSDKDLDDVLHEVERDWKARREGHRGHLIEP